MPVKQISIFFVILADNTINKMNRKRILVVTTQSGELSNWSGMPQKFETIFTNTDEKAIELVQSQPFHLVVIDNSVEEIDFKKLAAILPILQSDIELLRFRESSFEELENEVQAIFIRKRNEKIKRVLVLDSSGVETIWNNLPAFSAN
jgi:CheY-like chemotaxis protein